MEIFISGRIILNTLFPYETVEVYLYQYVDNQLYRLYFNFTTLPLLTWIEVISQANNNLLSFILTNGFGVEYNFLNFHCEDSFTVLFECVLKDEIILQKILNFKLLF